jgi:hypothetical protein
MASTRPPSSHACSSQCATATSPTSSSARAIATRTTSVRRFCAGSAAGGCGHCSASSGFRLYNRRALELFDETYPYDFPEPESLALARRSGLRISEQPVTMRARQGGSSSIIGFSTLYYMLKVTIAIVLTTVRTRRRVPKEEDSGT